MHGYNLLHSLNEVPVTIENSRHAGQDIVVPAFDFSKVKMSDIHLGEDNEFGIVFARFGKTACAT